MSLNKVIFSILLIPASFEDVLADYLVVSRSATIRETPHRDVTIVKMAQKGDTLNLLDDGIQQNGYYHVSEQNTSLNGWIYRTLVRRYEGHLNEDISQVTVTVIDVGAGLSCLIELPNDKFIVYDAGRTSAMDYIRTIIPQGHDIELLVLSHTDADHWEATESIVNEYQVQRVIRTDFRVGPYSQTYTKGVDAINNAPYQINDQNLGDDNVHFTPGDIIYDHDDVRLYFLCGFKEPPAEWHLTKESHKNNAVSIVVKLEYRGQSIIFTGDAVGKEDADCSSSQDCIATEQFMINTLSDAMLDADVLLAAHHGADNSSCTEFIEKVNPEYVIFSAGHSYKHPRQVTADRYMDLGVDVDKIFRTDRGDHEVSTGEECKLEWDYQMVANSSDGKGDDHVRINLTRDRGLIVQYITTPTL